MSTTQQINTSEIQQWLNFNYTIEKIEADLKARGFDTDVIETYLKEFKKQRNAKQQFNGFICLGVGAFLGFISCLLSVLNPFPEYYYYILFGFTTLAICVIMAGLYFVFE